MIHSILAGLRRRVHTLVNDGFVRRLSKKLQLDDEQQVKLTILQSSVNTAREDVTKLRQERHSLIGELLAENGFNRDEALRIMNAPAQELCEHTDHLLDSLSQFFASLDSVQRERLRLLWLKHQPRHTQLWH